jgi:hypothetical protein
MAPDASQSIAFCVELAVEEHTPRYALGPLERDRKLDLCDVVFTFVPRSSDRESPSDRPGVRVECLPPIGGLEYERHHGVNSGGFSGTVAFIEVTMPVP